MGVLLGVGIVWLLGPSLVGSKLLTANDIVFFDAPFNAVRPASVTRPSNPYLADPVYVFHPQMQKAREAVRDGRLPLWDPDIGAGRPLLAAQLGAPLYPLTWLSFALPFWLSLAWIAALRILIAGAGTWLLCRRLGLSAAASTLAAVSFAFGSALVLAVEAPTVNIYALLPWILLSADRVVRGGRWTDAAFMGLLSGLTLLGGHPESVFVIAIAVVAFALWRLSEVRAGRFRGPPARATLRRLFGAAAIAAGIGAVAVVPFLELLSQSGDLYRGSPRLGASLFTESLFFPDRWGRPDKVQFVNTSAYAGRGVYIGAAAILLAVAGLAGRRRRDQLFFAGLAVGSFLLLADLPGATAVVRHTPLLSTMRTDYFLWPMVFALAILAGYGADSLARGDPGERRRTLLAMAAVAVLPLGWALARHGHLREFGDAVRQLPVMGADAPSVEVTELASYLRWACVAGLALAVVVVAQRLDRPGLAPTALAVILLVDLASLGHGYHPQVDKAVGNPPAPRSIRYLQSAGHEQRYVSELGAMGPNLSDRYGIYDVDSFSPPIVDRYGRLHDSLGGDLVVNLGRTRTDLAAPRSRDLLSVFGASHVLASAQAGPAEAGLTPAFDSGGQRVLSNPAALPRAWVAYDWRQARDAAGALRAVVASNPPALQKTPVIEGAPPARASGAPAGPARLTVDGDTRVTVEADAERPGQLILLDTFYPGWKATVDGRDAEIRPANAAFRAVSLPAGHHRVEFAYRPRSFIAGASASLAAGLVVLAILGGGLVQRRRVRPRANSA